VSLPNVAPAPNPGANNLPGINFTNGVATLTFVTADVGKYILNVRDDTRLYANAVDLGGAGSSILTRPWLYVAVPGNQVASVPGGNVFTSAGTNFSTTVRGVLWQAADDVNDDGVADAGANLANNTVAPSFAWDTTLSAVAPFTPAAGTFNRASSGNTVVQANFSGGSATTADWRYSEVGSFTLLAAAANYLNSGVTVSTSNGVVGRFTPAYFNVARTEGCTAGAFTYSGQPFQVTVTAYNALDAVTQNYHSAFGFAKDVAISSGGDATNFSNNTLSGASAFTGGSGMRGDVTYTFPAKESAPVTLTLRAVDGDGISSAGHTEPAALIRSGRIQIFNAFGSELVDLSVPMRVQHYQDDTNGWVAHANDNCTAVTLAFQNPQGNLAANETCVQDDGTPGGLSGIGCPAAGPVLERFREAPVPGFDGNFNLFLRAPGLGNNGGIDVSGDLLATPWLRFNWDGAGGDDDPRGRAAFGIYKGSPRQIYLRERY
jgi:MSHA biogenesis protein MshQ